MKLLPLKLHIKTTIAVSAVMVAVFAVVVYLSYSATTRLTIGQQQQETQLAAARIEATVEHHIRRNQKAEKKAVEAAQEGAFDFIRKPFNVNEVIRIARR